MSTRVIKDGSIAGHVPEIPAFRVVTADVFSERAERFRALAPGHALQAYLDFAAALSFAQADTLRSSPMLPVPDESTLAHCREHGLPPLSVDGHRRDPAWRQGLTQLIDKLARASLPRERLRSCDALQAGRPDHLESGGLPIC